MFVELPEGLHHGWEHKQAPGRVVVADLDRHTRSIWPARRTPNLAIGPEAEIQKLEDLCRGGSNRRDLKE
jgi:hypothetical protein